MNSKQEKAMQVFEVVSHTAKGITTVFKTMPRTGKKHRNIFVKSYNRRPQNKTMAQAAMKAVLGAMQLHAVMVRPIPKYQKGTI